MSLDAVIGSPSANAYTDVGGLEATYWDLQLGEVRKPWEALGPADKEREIKWGTKAIESAWIWNGARAAETQSLNHPRTGLADINGRSIADNVIAPQVIDALGELIRLRLVGDWPPSEDVITRDRVVGLDTTFVPEFPETLPRQVRQLLAPLGSSAPSGRKMTLTSRGTL